MLKHLAQHADARGVLRDLPTVLAAYQARHAVGRRTGWTDLDRAYQAGLVRQLHAAAPGRQASYILAMDVAGLPADLPADLRAALQRYVDDPRAAAKGTPTRAQVHRALAECQVIRHGSARRITPIMESEGCGRLHTSPFTREGSPPSPQPRQSQSSQRARRLPFKGEDLGEERTQALSFVKELCPIWAYNRVAGDIPSDTQLAELAPLVGLLLRRMPRSEVAELLTERIGSAADLAGVLRWRLGRTLGGLRRAERRAAAIVVDDDGARHAAWLEGNAAAAAARAAAKAEVVELARRRDREIRQQREAAQDLTRRPEITAPGFTAPTGVIAPSRPITEPEGVFQREISGPLAESGQPAAPGHDGRARALARAASERAARDHVQPDRQPRPAATGELGERLAALADGSRPASRTPEAPEAPAPARRTPLQARLAALAAGDRSHGLPLAPRPAPTHRAGRSSGEQAALAELRERLAQMHGRGADGEMGDGHRVIDRTKE